MPSGYLPSGQKPSRQLPSGKKPSYGKPPLQKPSEINIIGIDIGGTKCSVILGRYNPMKFSVTIIKKITFKTAIDSGPAKTLENITCAVTDILSGEKMTPEDIIHMGISCGGPLDSKKGIIMSPPNLPGWDNINIKQYLEERFGIKLSLLNDANACALAEWKFGAARGLNDVIFLTFGTGLGAGLILGGKLYEGANGMAGEVGHIRLADHGPVGYGKEGSFEGFCSGGGIRQIALTRITEKLQMGEKVSFCESLGGCLDGIDAKMVGDAAEKGDALAAEIYKISGRYLGKGLSVLIDILNPEMIVIGSIYARSGNLLMKSMVEAISEESLAMSAAVCKIVPAGLGESIGDYGALAAALYNSGNNGNRGDRGDSGDSGDSGGSGSSGSNCERWAF